MEGAVLSNGCLKALKEVSFTRASRLLRVMSVETGSTAQKIWVNAFCKKTSPLCIWPG